MYARAVDIAQAAETLGFRNVWLAEHHFSTYGYVSRPAQLATYLAAKTTRLRSFARRASISAVRTCICTAISTTGSTFCSPG
jgi:hypothetical protein